MTVRGTDPQSVQATANLEQSQNPPSPVKISYTSTGIEAKKRRPTIIASSPPVTSPRFHRNVSTGG